VVSLGDLSSNEQVSLTRRQILSPTYTFEPVVSLGDLSSNEQVSLTRRQILSPT